MFIVGISGKKQSGKSTLAEGLREWLDIDSQIVSFAGPLREIVSLYFANPVEGSFFHNAQLQRESVKNTKHLSGLTYRELLQKVGVYFRELWPEVWIKNYIYGLNHIYRHYKYILTPDVRFPNEVEAIHDMGGLVIRLTRNPFDDKHESETALDNYDNFDFVIKNDTLSIKEQLLVAEMFLKGKIND